MAWMYLCHFWLIVDSEWSKIQLPHMGGGAVFLMVPVAVHGIGSVCAPPASGASLHCN